jgi:hypothetical protein
VIPELDIEAYRAWIGREENGDDIVTSELVKRFRASPSRVTIVSRGGRTPGGAERPASVRVAYEFFADCDLSTNGPLQERLAPKIWPDASNGRSRR